MKLRSFKAENLFSFERIELGLESRGLVLVTGLDHDRGSSNASGKSSLTSKGLIWTLYGKTPSGLRSDTAIRKGQTSCYGEVVFYGSNNELYTIKRERGPSKLSVYRQDTKSGENDKGFDISKKTQADTQELIDFLLGKDYETFLHTDFFGQGFLTSFMSLSSSQQNTLLETTISMDQINLWIESAKLNKNQINAEINKLNSEYFLTHGQLVEVRKLAREQHLKDVETQNQLTQLNLQLSDLAVLEPIYNKIAELYKNCEDWRLKCSNSVINIQRGKASLIARQKQIKPSLCPTCDQTINLELYNKLCSEQADIALQIKDHEDALVRAKTNENSWTVKSSEYKKELDKVQAQLSEMKLVQSKIKILTDLLNTQTDWHAREIELVNYQVLLDNALSNKIEELKIAEFWESAFKIDFKSFIFEKVCPFLEQRATKYLNGLGQPQMSVKFSTVKELKSGDQKISFNVSVESGTGGNGFETFSGGEQQLVSFAVGLAFSDLVKRTSHSESNIMILDEPFMALDEVNAERLITYIRDHLAKEKESIFLVSNENSIKELVPQRIEIVKENGVSRILN